MQLVGAFVIGHFSIDGKLKADHYNFSAMHNMFIINAPVETGCVKSVPVSLFQEVIEKFSYGGQMAMTNAIYILYTCVIDLRLLIIT